MCIYALATASANPPQMRHLSEQEAIVLLLASKGWSDNVAAGKEKTIERRMKFEALATKLSDLSTQSLRSVVKQALAKCSNGGHKKYPHLAESVYALNRFIFKVPRNKLREVIEFAPLSCDGLRTTELMPWSIGANKELRITGNYIFVEMSSNFSLLEEFDKFKIRYDRRD